VIWNTLPYWLCNIVQNGRDGVVRLEINSDRYQSSIRWDSAGGSGPCNVKRVALNWIGSVVTISSRPVRSGLEAERNIRDRVHRWSGRCLPGAEEPS
jgi:hypothetical protein